MITSENQPLPNGYASVGSSAMSELPRWDPLWRAIIKNMRLDADKVWSLQHWRRWWEKLTPPEQLAVLQKFLLVVVLVMASGGLLVLFQASHTVSQFRHPTMVYDQDGNPWFDLHDPLGTHLKLSGMPAHVARAAIAVEDRRFYRHGSIDLRGIARAAWQNLKAGGIREGASTLTQQLARQLFLTHHRTFSRKLQEILLSSELESQFSKDEILEAYLNRIFMGGSLYGMPDAARYFFGKDVTQISISEAAALAAIIRSPNFYNPKVNPDRLIDRRNVVLRRMSAEGYITPAEYERAVREKLKFVRKRVVERTETYFKEFVRSELVDLLGEEILDEYGYRIHTSYLPQLQALAENAANQEIARLEVSKQLYKYPDQPELQVALVSIEVGTGRIQAMVGGRNYGGSQYNHVTQALRQPGSAFKPVLYATALLHGYTPASMIELPAVQAPTPSIEESNLEESKAGEPDAKQTAKEATRETKSEQPTVITLREALTKSVNSAALALIAKVGKAKTIELARQLGIHSDLPAVESLALGTGEVRVLELTEAYLTFASGGDQIQPHCILRVEDRGNRALYEEKQVRKPALSREVAYQMVSMLRDVVTRGTGATNATAGVPFPIAGKTGTTNDYKDAWFVGFSPKIACGVWVGYDNPHPIMPAGYGARVALPIWGRYMRSTAKSVKHGSFTVPPSLRAYNLCRISGGIATEGCNFVVRPDGAIHSAVYTEYLIPGTEPTFPCSLHALLPGGEHKIWEELKKLLPKIIPPWPH
ncbi:MAG: PBP1A family penicillin-binding protein [Acidobacteria bacterium]|nr:PBP1A family penicillin-binding protein [Acidobacteriota bacterium]